VSRRRLLRVAWLLTLGAVVALLGFGLSRGASGTIDSALEDGRRPAAPDLHLPRLGGGEASLARWRGRVVVLNFWASWCDPCREESPVLQRFHERIRREGGTVLGVDALDVTSDARAFVEEHGLTYPMLRDGDGERLDDFGVRGYPETFVLDRKGRVAAVRHGPVDERWLRETVDPVLAERT
jgi:cytochrome c biogenesis protein CcmG, thiol:disulfide interchange protein DsbE